MAESESWDVVVVGSGIGGLAAAAALGKRGHRVLLLEQHSQPGGQTQTFRRQDWVFATGVHYIGGVGPQAGEAGRFGRLLAWLSDGALTFAPCANPYDIVHLPGFEFGIPHPEAAYRAALMARFPHQAAAIDHWFDTLHAARRAAFTSMAHRAMPAWMAAAIRLFGGGAGPIAERTLAEELAGIADTRLRAVLGARWGDHGAPPQWAPLTEHALVTSSYDEGAYYPIGGPARFAQTLLPPVLASGGACRVGAEVRHIELKDGRVHAVHWWEGGQLHRVLTAHVISAMGARNTVAALGPDEATAWRSQVQARAAGAGCVALYIGLQGDIAAAGATSANHWIYASEDIGRLWCQPADEDAPSLFVSFPSLKDPDWSGPHTAEVLAPVDSQAFAAWLQAAQDADMAEYAGFKAWIANRLLDQFERHFPALAPLVRFHEAATPLTQRRYVRTPEGAMYGLEMTVERMADPSLRMRTPVPGLLLAGQDVLGPGVQPSCMAGLLAAASIDSGLWRELGR